MAHEPPSSEARTARLAAKSDRRTQLRAAAAHLLAERGYHGLRLEDLGAAVGVSGPAIYRHFDSKDALLADLLVDISERLLTGGAWVRDNVADPTEALQALLDVHLNFTLKEPDLIRIQDRDLHNLPPASRQRVRRLQRRYVKIWVNVVRQLQPDLSAQDATAAVHATFGLLNSTPHSARSADVDRTASMLRRMSVHALANAGGAS